MTSFFLLTHAERTRILSAGESQQDYRLRVGLDDPAFMAVMDANRGREFDDWKYQGFPVAISFGDGWDISRSDA